jgi:hypothetical protein
MKKILILTLVLFLGTHTLKAQIHGGVKGGLSMATMNVDAPVGYDTPFKLGFWGGGFLVLGDGLFRFQPEVLYVQKGVSLEKSGTVEYARSTMSYLEVPLMTRIHLGFNIVNLYFNVGGYGGYWLSGKTTAYFPDPTTGQLGETTTDYEFDDDFDNRFDAGLVFGVGVKVTVVLLEVRYSLGLVNSQKTGENKNDTKLSYLGVALGVQF